MRKDDGRAQRDPAIRSTKAHDHEHDDQFDDQEQEQRADGHGWLGEDHRPVNAHAYREEKESKKKVAEWPKLIGEVMTVVAFGQDKADHESGNRERQSVAALGAWAQEKLEPVVPDAIDQGEKPFIKPFMVRLADDHYALDISRAERLLGWRPRHRLKDELPRMIAALKRDPLGWYKKNGLRPPAELEEAAALGEHPEELRQKSDERYRRDYTETRWAHFVNLMLGTWLITQPPLIGVTEPALRWTEIISGVLLIVFAGLSLSWHAHWARWASAAIGALVMAAPFVLWTENATAYSLPACRQFRGRGCPEAATRNLGQRQNGRAQTAGRSGERYAGAASRSWRQRHGSAR